MERCNLGPPGKIPQTVAMREHVHLHTGSREILDHCMAASAIPETETVNKEEAGEWHGETLNVV